MVLGGGRDESGGGRIPPYADVCVLESITAGVAQRCMVNYTYSQRQRDGIVGATIRGPQGEEEEEEQHRETFEKHTHGQSRARIETTHAR